MEAPAATWKEAASSSQRSRTGRPPRARHKKAAQETAQFFNAAFEQAEKTFPDLWEHLTEHGRHALVRELVDAFFSHEPEPPVAIQEVIDAWYRTLTLRRSPGYDDAVARRGKTPEELGERTYTLDELRDRLSG